MANQQQSQVQRGWETFAHNPFHHTDADLGVRRRSIQPIMGCLGDSLDTVSACEDLRWMGGGTHPWFLLQLPLQSRQRRKGGVVSELPLCCWLFVWLPTDPDALKCAAFDLAKIRALDCHFKEACTQIERRPFEQTSNWMWHSQLGEKCISRNVRVPADCVYM